MQNFGAHKTSYLLLERNPSTPPLYRELLALSVAGVRVRPRNGPHGNIRSRICSHFICSKKTKSYFPEQPLVAILVLSLVTRLLVLRV